MMYLCLAMVFGSDMLIVVLVLGAVLSTLVFLVYAGDRACGADWGNVWVNRIDGMIRLWCRYAHGLGNVHIPLPAHGAALVVSNHISGLDPLLLIAAARRPLRFLIAREEYERFGLRWLFKAAGCIPVDRGGRTDKAFRGALRALAGGEVIALFPHGRIHVGRQRETAPPLKGGVIKLAQKTGTVIFPVYISGVSAKGRVLTSLLVPSRVRVAVHEAVDCANREFDTCLECIARILHSHDF